MRDSEFIVIGAGIADASAAYELSKIGSTINLERESQPEYQTTGRSAAVFSEIYGNTTIRVLTVGSRSFFASLPPACPSTLRGSPAARSRLRAVIR
jgi:D-arginine dehydrogenase